MKITRLVISIISGAVLGVICIIGGSVRAGGFSGNEVYLLAMWYNRVILGMMVGFAGAYFNVKSLLARSLRGALLGLLVSLAFYLSSNFRDLTAFVAGVIYGIIIELVLWTFFDRVEQRKSG